MIYILFLIFIINSVIMNSSNFYDIARFMQIEEILLCICAWNFLSTGSNKGKSVFVILIWYYIFVVLTQDLLSGIIDNYYSIELAALAFIISFIYYKNYNKVGDKINKDNVNLIFYKKQKSYKQTVLGLPSEPVSSFGMIIGKLYQLRYKKKTIQELDYDEEDIYEKYIVIDTGFPISNITKEDIDLLLKQKARQAKTLWLRLNCLRSCKHILNKIKGYEYKGELLPSIYLRRIR